MDPDWQRGPTLEGLAFVATLCISASWWAYFYKSVLWDLFSARTCTGSKTHMCFRGGPSHRELSV